MKYANVSRTQRVDEKNRRICLVMFSPTFLVIKMSQMTLFFVFSADDSKKPVSFYKILKCI